MRYLQVSERQIPPGRSALVLFAHEGELCAGRIEHRCDGRRVRHVPARPQPSDLLPAISALMGSSADKDFLVVIEDGAYWPESFPLLSLQRNR